MLGYSTLEPLKEQDKIRSMEQINLPQRTRITKRWIKVLGIYLVVSSIILFLIIFILMMFCIASMNCPAPPVVGWISMFVIMAAPPNPFFPLDIIDYNHVAHFTYKWDHFFRAPLRGLFFGILLIFLSYLLSKKTKKGWIVSSILFALFIILPSVLFYLLLLVGLPEILEEIKTLSIFEVLVSMLILINLFLVVPLFYIVPFVILLIDRKNFWKIAT